jgi:REP element-mobilizing transposase RayT/cephalosporin hydroxylase
MSHYIRPKVPGASVFFTVALADRGSDVLVREVEALRQAVRMTKAERPFRIDAWVVLPDHMHCVWTLPEGDADFSGRWREIKGQFSMALRRSGLAPTFAVVGGGRVGVNPDLRVAICIRRSRLCSEQQLRLIRTHIMQNPRPLITSDDEFTFDGLRYLTSTTDFSKKTGPDGIVLLKPKQWIEMYCDIVERESIRNVLELGVWQGGMSVLLPSFETKLRYLGIDFSQEIVPLMSLIAGMPKIRDRIRIDFGTSQSDPSLPARIVDYFGSPNLDLVVDDASHMYEQTRRSFELFFPMLRPGAPYIVEDWGWAHWPNYKPDKSFAFQPCLSNLLFEVAILAASAPDIVASVEINSAMFIVRRGPAEIKSGWRLTDSLRFNDQSQALPLLKPSNVRLLAHKLGLLRG